MNPGTIPLPSHLARKPESRKDLTSSIPSHGTPFGDTGTIYQWAEFSSARPPHNLCITPVDLSKPERIWYYLGKTSTECRAQYTENPDRPFNNPKSHFLESVKSLNFPTMASHSHIANHPTKQLGSLPAAPPRHSQAKPSIHTPAVPIKPEPANSELNNKFPILTSSDRASQITTARRLVASITDHANICAGYTIVNTDFVVQTLLGQTGFELPKNGMDKLKTAMSESTVQKKMPDGAIRSQLLDINDPEVDHLLRMLRFAIINLPVGKNDIAEKKPMEKVVKETLKEPHTTPNVAGKWAYLDIQRRQSSNVYQSPYAPGFGFSKFAIEEYGLTGEQHLPHKESLAKDFFDRLSAEDKEKILQVCGDVLRSPKKAPSIATLEPTLDVDDASPFEPQLTSTLDDIMNVDDNHLSAFDMTLHAESPNSSFDRSHLRFHSPQDFSLHMDNESSVPRHLNDHQDLFGDQQANQRFWQRSAAWAEGYTPSHEGDRPFFGPQERPNDYAVSEVDVGRGPGSLHSMDMAGFGFDGTDEPYPDLSP